MKLMKTFEQFCNESVQEREEIEITLRENDERNPNDTEEKYDVSYIKYLSGGEFFEIEGTIKTVHDLPVFEVDYFTNQESEDYWDENWEEIEDKIINKFTELY